MAVFRTAYTVEAPGRDLKRAGFVALGRRVQKSTEQYRFRIEDICYYSAQSSIALSLSGVALDSLVHVPLSNYADFSPGRWTSLAKSMSLLSVVQSINSNSNHLVNQSSQPGAGATEVGASLSGALVSPALFGARYLLVSSWSGVLQMQPFCPMEA